MAECAKLLAPSEVSSLNDLAIQYSYLKTKLETLNSSDSSGFNVTIPIEGIPVALNADQARQRASYLEEKLGVTWDIKQTIGALHRGILSHQTSAYKTCVAKVLEANQPIMLDVVSVTADHVAAKIRIGSQPAARGRLELTVTSNGEFSQPVQKRWTIGGGSTSVNVYSLNPGRSLLITASVRAGGNELGRDSVAIPPLIRATETAIRETRRSETASASCGGTREHVVTGQGAPVSIKAAANERLEHDQFQGYMSKQWNNGFDPNRQYLQYGAGLGFEVRVKSPQEVTAIPYCSFRADETLWWEGFFTVPIVRSEIVITAPPDNGVDVRKERLAPEV